MHITSTYFSSDIPVYSLMVQDDCRLTSRSWSRISENFGSLYYDEIAISGVIGRVRTIAESDCYLHPICLSICLCPSVCPSVSLCISQSVSQSVCLSVCLSMWNNSAGTGRIFIKFNIWRFFEKSSLINLLKTNRNLLYIRNQFVPRSKRFAPRL